MTNLSIASQQLTIVEIYLHVYFNLMESIVFLGRSLETLREFPSSAKRASGYELDKVQRGFDPRDWKAMPSIGPGVREIRIRVEGAWRAALKELK